MHGPAQSARANEVTDARRTTLVARALCIAAGAPAAIIVGSDCLDLDTLHLQQAAQALADHELVLAPAIEGGFVLIGCRQADPQLFREVTWSSPEVLEQTLANARRLGYRTRLLEALRDIDTLQDVEHYPELLAMVASS